VLIGKNLLHYQVVEKIGEGGMGAVYKARDTHLDRFVALKILPPEKTSDSDRRLRFVQEAKAASALNHPNIVHIYDIFTAEGLEVIAMEYVEGRTLDREVERAGMKLGRALGYAAQIADALAKAHANGIVHRDLKPSNVMVTNDGVVKLLDFGLAKLVESPTEIDSSLPTKSARAVTDEGVVLGTAAYMSPEQAQGLEVDARSDVFSFGVVLYEMLTGVQAFQRESPLATLAAILKEEPKAPSQIVERLPRELDRLVHRCLVKERERRWQNMSDLQAVIEDLKEESDSGRLSGIAPVPVRPQRSRFPVTVVAVLVAVIGAGVVWWLRSRPPASRTALDAARFTTDPGITNAPTITPDGKLVAYASDRSGEGHLDIWVQQFDGRQPIRRTDHEADDTNPSFSPDGSKIVFQSQRDGGGLYIMDTLGGEARRLVDGGFFPKFSPDGSLIVFTRAVAGAQGALGGAYKIFLMSSEGGAPRAFQPGFTMTGLSPPFGGKVVWSPDGDYLVFSGQSDTEEKTPEWWAAPIDGSAPVPTGVVRYLDTAAAIHVPEVWVGDQLVFGQGTAADGVNLYSLGLSLGDLSVSGPAVRLTTGGGLQFGVALADDGRMLYTDTVYRFNFYRARFDLGEGRVAGEIDPVTMDSSMKSSPTLSKDGSVFVYNANVSVRGRRIEARRLDMNERDETVVFATPNGLNTYPHLSPDGTLVAYHDFVDDKQRAHVVGGTSAAGTQICEACSLLAFTNDSKQALIRHGGVRLLLQDLDTGRQKEVLKLAHGRIMDACLSPDNEWLAFQVIVPESGLSIYVAPLGTDSIREDQWIGVAKDPEHIESPRWSADGNVIYFISEWNGEVSIWAQRLEPSAKTPAGDPFVALQPQRFRRGMVTVPRGARSFAVGPDFIVFLAGEITSNLWTTILPGVNQ
jgi:serine/threonine protein kinase/Tol biopolymer transport system component